MSAPRSTSWSLVKTSGANSNWRKGAELVLTQKIGSKFTVYAQGDFGSEDFPTAVGAKTVAADWYAGGLWGVYQFTDKVGYMIGYNNAYYNYLSSQIYSDTLNRVEHSVPVDVLRWQARPAWSTVDSCPIML